MQQWITSILTGFTEPRKGDMLPYRTAFSKPKAVVGRQEETLHNAIVWVLPNPSGLNAHYQLKDLAEVFRELLLAINNF